MTIEPQQQDLATIICLQTKEYLQASSKHQINTRYTFFPSTDSNKPLYFNALDLYSHGLKKNAIHLYHEILLILLFLSLNILYLALSCTLEMVQRIHSCLNLIRGWIRCDTLLREEFHTLLLNSLFPRLIEIRNLILLKLSLEILAFTYLEMNFSLILYFVHVPLLFSWDQKCFNATLFVVYS